MQATAHAIPHPGIHEAHEELDFWRKYVGRSGEVIGIDRFGESAPAGELFRSFGFTAERVAEAVKSVLARRADRRRSMVLDKRAEARIR